MPDFFRASLMTTPPPAATPPAATPTPDANAQPTPPAAPATPAATPPVQALIPTTLDIAKYEKEYAESGKLSDESRKTITDGLARTFGEKAAGAIFDNYVSGLSARGQARDQQITELAGGAEQYNTMVQWAAAHLSSADVAAYNDAVKSNDPIRTRQAVNDLATQWQRANGVEPTLMKGRPGDAGPAQFKSAAEMRTAMNDPKYKTDPAYRKEVEQRLIATPSDVLGF